MCFCGTQILNFFTFEALDFKKEILQINLTESNDKQWHLNILIQLTQHTYIYIIYICKQADYIHKNTPIYLLKHSPPSYFYNKRTIDVSEFVNEHKVAASGLVSSRNTLHICICVCRRVSIFPIGANINALVWKLFVGCEKMLFMLQCVAIVEANLLLLYYSGLCFFNPYICI